MSTQKQAPEKEDTPKQVSKESLQKALRIFRFIRPYRWQLVIGLILLAFGSLTFMAFPYLSGLMVDVAQGRSEIDITLNQIGLLLGGILLFQAVVSYFRVLTFAQVSERGVADVRKALYDKLITLPISFYEKNQTGELISRLTADVERLYSAFSITIAEFIRQILLLVVGVGVLFYRAPRLSLIMLATFPVIVLLAMFFGKYIRKLSKQRQEHMAEANVILSESTQTIQMVKTFTSELFQSQRYGLKMSEVVRVSLKYAHGRALMAVFIIFFLFGALFFIIWQGARMVQLGTGGMTAGMLIEFVVLTGLIGGAIAGLGNFYTDLLGAIGATERLRDILDEEGEPTLVSTDSHRNRLSGRIEYKNLHFHYPTRTDVPVLQGIDMRVEPGEKVALVGPSGAGKSTIVALLLRFYPWQSGELLVDGRSILDYEISDYRSNIALVPQEVILFGGTIAENIRYGKPNATEAEVREAADKANALEFIDQFPEGMETIVGERGVKLSGGQRQRIAIARAILKDPVILLLDEATSSLDAESERLVQDALNVLMEGRTSIIIAHRLATIRDVDRIYVLEDGRIVETGSHTELTEDEEGVYNHLVRLQMTPG